ncbi:MAG: DNA polymerase IV [Eubacteriales bacterium]|nr:DNA polymerase IV [Eubacteriales bacterium]
MQNNSRKILHCDMNNFYASVECMLDPSLRSHPVAVCGSVEERHGIVLAKNYKAKAFNVKTGEAVWQAKEKCPDLVVVPPHYEEYLKYSKLARAVYNRYTDQVEPYGMDECWLDITGSEKIMGSAERVANEIRETMKFELGLTISVGVSFNKVFAKLGSDMKKPDAVTVIDEDTFQDKIWGLPASDMLGVGAATNKVLESYFIHTIGDLAHASPDLLQRRLGKNGIAVWNFANGRDYSVVQKSDVESPIKSVGHGTTTMKDLVSPDEVWPVILELSQDIGHKLRVHEKRATGVSIYVRDNSLAVNQWQMPLDYPSQSSMDLARTAFSLFQRRYMWYKPIRSITVQAINLIPQKDPYQLFLFTDIERIEKMERIDECVEDIRRRFGKEAIKNAVLCSKALSIPPEHVAITMPTGMIG